MTCNGGVLLKMESTTKSIILYLLNKKIIGGCHTPEDKIIKSKTKWLTGKDKKSFEKEYKYILNEGYIIRLKKRTKKGTDWHISLNPRKLRELNELL